MKARNGSRGQLHSFLNSVLDGGVQLHASVALSPQEEQPAPTKEVGPSAGLDVSGINKQLFNVPW
jgi:hypothetical protein